MPLSQEEQERWTGLFPDPRETSRNVVLWCVLFGHVWLTGCNDAGKPIRRCLRCWRIVRL